MIFILLKNKYFFRCVTGLLLTALGLIPVSGFAQGEDAENKSPISVETHVAPAQATVGDIITYSVRVRHDPNIEPFPPKFTPPKGLESIDQGTRKLPPQKNQQEREFWFRLRADRVGSYDFPSIPLSFEAIREGNEKIPGHIATPKAELQVQSILRLQGEPTDIRDIKPLAETGRNWLTWVWAIFAMLLAIALVILYLRKRRNRPEVPAPTAAENLSPQEMALRELEVLKNKGLLERGLVREYYFALSEIFRRYLTARYDFPALDWTTQEIKDHLRDSAAIATLSKDKIGKILELTDLIKFAKAPATREENMMEEIRLLIQATSRTTEPASTTTNPSADS